MRCDCEITNQFRKFKEKIQNPHLLDVRSICRRMLFHFSYVQWSENFRFWIIFNINLDQIWYYNLVYLWFRNKKNKRRITGEKAFKSSSLVRWDKLIFIICSPHWLLIVSAGPAQGPVSDQAKTISTLWFSLRKPELVYCCSQLIATTLPAPQPWLSGQCGMWDRERGELSGQCGMWDRETGELPGQCGMWDRETGELSGQCGIWDRRDGM